MKTYLKIVILIMLLQGVCTDLKAIPAYPFPVTVIQPDGSSIILRQFGDEFMNYITTDDGYTVTKDQKGFYVYSQFVDGQLLPTNCRATNVAQRSQTEKTFLSAIKRHQVPLETDFHKLQKRERETTIQSGLLRQTKGFDYGKFKGLIILVEFSDRRFETEEINNRISGMVNQKNYLANGSTGSVRDYFYDNSLGAFEPTFDIVGPVTIDYRQTDARQTANAYPLAMAACTAADQRVDFSNYDLDGDRKVDMIYFIFAGAGSHIGGNNVNYLWPHASTLPDNFMLDNVTFGRYACSVELNGLEGSHVQDGIGTIVHEFSHVLGLKDYYDVDYSSSGGESEHPDTWSVMATGSYFNKSKTPCNYSLYERYALGWADPQLISGDGQYTLEALHASNKGYRINSAIEQEFFLLENRQPVKWDNYLPGHGMLVFRVDSTDASAWTSNRVNVDPKHLHYEMLRASKTIQNKVVVDSSGDPFPGTGQITSLTNQTAPSILSWSGLQTETVLTDISETRDGKITFTTATDKLLQYVEDFEEMAVTTSTARNVQGKFSKWDFTKAFVQIPGSDKANGTKSVGIYKGGELKTTTSIENDINSASFCVWNPTKYTATVRLYYSVNKGVSWIMANTSSNTILADVEAGEHAQLMFNINSKQPTVYKINMTAGGTSSDELCYIDDFALKYSEGLPPVSLVPLPGEAENHLSIFRDGNHFTVKSPSVESIQLYSVDGHLIDTSKPGDGQAEFHLPVKGVYLLFQAGQCVKIIY